MLQKIYKYYWVLILIGLSVNPSWTVASPVLIELTHNPFDFETKLRGSVTLRKEIKEEFSHELPASTSTTIYLNSKVNTKSSIDFILIPNKTTDVPEAERTVVASGQFIVPIPLCSLQITFDETEIRFNPTYNLPPKFQDDTL